MSSRFFTALRDAIQRGNAQFNALFKRQQSKQPSEPSPAAPQTETEPVLEASSSSSAQEPASVLVAPLRDTRLWNIGLDFGTAFTKCIVRNLATDEAFIVPLGKPPYFLPSEVLCENGGMWVNDDPVREGHSRTVKYLKMALVDTSSEQMNSTWIKEFAQTTDLLNDRGLAERAELFTTYFLARVIQKARAFVLSQAPDFDEAGGDRCYVNMAVPVAHAEQPSIANSFDRCLRRSWILAREAALVNMSSDEIAMAFRKCEDNGEDIGCYIYPEVSANVQSYIKSRAGADGLYLFTDVGAGTVDLSVFIYFTHPTNDRPISYVSAGVIPLGSTHIEARAVHQAANLSRLYIDGRLTELQERIRLVKEGHRANDETIGRAIRAAESAIEEEMFCQAAPILAQGRTMIRTTQWHNLKILLGGGGADTPLYRRAVNRWFEKFSHFSPEPAPIPLPTDLRWPPNIPEVEHARLFRRFSVAYGLSFGRADLEDHRFPRDVGPLPQPDEETPLRTQAPTKDEC